MAASTATNLAQDQFVTQVSQQTGIDPRVLYAWTVQEGAYAPGGTGGYNFLNLRPYQGDPYSSVSGGGFEQFATVSDAVTATVRRLEQPFASGILASTKQTGATPSSEIAAIAASAWDAGHYGGPGGPNLLATFQRIYSGQGAEGALQPPVPPVSKDVASNIGAGYGVVGGAAKSAASAVVSPITSVEKAVEFIFSYRFLEIVGGLALVAVGAVSLAREATGNKTLVAIVPSIPGGGERAAYRQGQSQGRQARARAAGRREASRGETAATVSERPEPAESQSERSSRLRAAAPADDDIPF